MRRNHFNHIILIKKLLITGIGILTYPVLNVLNKTRIRGTEHLQTLPERNVLIVSNHHTYFMDVIAMYHVILSARSGNFNSIRNPKYLLRPWEFFHFVAAAETMKTGFIPKVFSYTGSISIKRTWREGDKKVERKLDINDVKKIGVGLEHGWVVTFPQGTTKQGAPGRMGTAHLIKNFQPIVIPLVIDGFNTAFDKTGLKLKKTGIPLKLRFKQPVKIDYEAPPEDILAQIMEAIEQPVPVLVEERME